MAPIDISGITGEWFRIPLLFRVRSRIPRKREIEADRPMVPAVSRRFLPPIPGSGAPLPQYASADSRWPNSQA